MATKQYSLAKDGAQLGTQRFNVGIDGAIVGVLRIFPHAIHQLLAGPDAAWRLE